MGRKRTLESVGFLVALAVFFGFVAWILGYLLPPIARLCANFMMRRRWPRVRNAGLELDRATSHVENLPWPEPSGWRRYVTMTNNAIARFSFGAAPAVILVGAAAIALVVATVIDDPPADGPPTYNYSEHNNSDYDDSGYDTCVADCTDMDNDGRTWDDVDADGDGVYETP